MFELADDILYLRAGTRFDRGTDPKLDIVIGVAGSEFRKSFVIPIDNISGPGEPVLTGERKVGAQLVASTVKNIVIERIEWKASGDSRILSDIELLRVETPGDYQVTVIYWMRHAVLPEKQPTQTWATTVSIAALSDKEMSDAGEAGQSLSFEMSDPPIDEDLALSLPEIG